LQGIANNVFGEVAILIGLITLLGLVLQRKPVEDVVGGALRATIGVVILFIGVEVFTEGLASFQVIVASAVGLEPPESSNTLGDFLSTHGGTVALIITVAFFLHLLAVRLLDTRYVYLTGHLMFWISVIVTAALVQVFGDVGQLTLVLAGSVVVAAYWTLQPLYVAPLMRRVTDSDEWGYGHTSSFTCFVAGKVGPLVGSKERNDTERLSVPRRLSFFKDVNVSTALVIGIVLLGAMIFADRGVIEEQAAAFGGAVNPAAGYGADINPWVWGVLAAIRFAAGIAILLFGVRMFLAEIVPAFKGISEKLIPGSRPALDAPTIFPFAQTAVMIGFVSGTLVFLAFMGAFAALGLFVLVPPMIMLFFPGAATAVFGNAFGGWRGAVLGGALNGIFLAVGQALTWGMLSDTAPEIATLADPDWYLIIWFLMAISAPLSAAGEAAIWGVPAIVLALFAVSVFFLKRRQPAPVEPEGEAPVEAPDR
jgi:ascorbate PTS system EIIC component